MATHRAGADRHSQRRIVAAAALLALSLALAAILVVQYIQTAARHRVVAEQVVQDYADFAAYILATHINRQLGDAATQTFAAWTPPQRPFVPPSLACSGGNSFFEERDDGIMRLSGAPLPALQTEFLKDSLLRGGMALRLLQEAHWRFRFVRAPEGPVDGYFILRRSGVIGFSACFRDGAPPSGAPSMFRHIMLTERALPGGLMGQVPPDSIFSLAIAAGGGRPLYASPGAHPSPFHGLAMVGPEHFGDLSVRVDLRPGSASRLIIGGLPITRARMALGLLALSAILVMTALLQLRREYQLMATRSTFVANVSHELRTPLSQILIFTELLKLNRLRSDAERARALDIIDQETRRLIRLVENVLQFSRAGAPKPRAHAEALPLNLTVRETVDAFRPLAAARGVTLHEQIPPDTSVRADRSGLKQILLNLLDNAVKYGPRDQIVRIEARSVDGRTRIAVDDQGPGIPADERERIWEGHYRLRRDTGTAVTGSGLGLAVVHALAREMRGSVWVEETETGGARFVVDLPSGADDPS